MKGEKILFDGKPAGLALAPSLPQGDVDQGSALLDEGGENAVEWIDGKIAVVQKEQK